jgi:ubiquinone/menaquinone biosynthesis C-methylase UbiE
MKAELEHNAIVHDDFEQQYLSLRRKEGRVYTDEQVKQLPNISADHPLAKEWKMRRFSAENLAAYFEEKKQTLKILEVGCGNGWLSHRLSLLQDVSVTGMDINSEELQQAKRVFHREGLDFIYGDPEHDVSDDTFDAVVFAASIQYFASLQDVIRTVLQKLKTGGEVHILDTYFYKAEELKSAAQRSKQYFAGIGFPMMERFYFHHSLEDLNEFSFQTLYDPETFKNRILKRSPFRWIRIKKC